MNATDILKLHNIKKTAGRLAIINALQESTCPLSENEIKELMLESYDRITFYRNIQTLTAVGIIHKIVVDNTLIRYGLNCCETVHEHSAHRNTHAHFYCEQCHSVVCLQEVKIPEFCLPEGFISADSDIIIKGKCEKCNH
ncbi:MAG: transcriptional repressor [Paludibacteraceae bacterium]|nr:transcriptional repressor [Paludibacteraceae bacterium]